MLRKTLAILIAIIWVGVLVAAPVQAGNGKQNRSGNKASTTMTQKGKQAGECPYGNTPGTRQGQAKAKGNGPGDGTGNNGTGPKDGTGPKGAAKKKGQPG